MTTEPNQISGADAIMLALQSEGVETVFGYPGGAIMPLYDALFRFGTRMKHVLVRHEQGSIHAAQGFARASGKTGVCISTSGPGATNLLTGLADAYADSTPVVCLTGQVSAHLIGSDAFQEADILSMTTPVTKWNTRITQVKDLLPALSHAFYIARTGRPGPVVVDLAKNVLFALVTYDYKICTGMPSYHPVPVPDPKKIRQAADWINRSKRPMLFWGQGVLLSGASNELGLLIDKAGLPAASTLMGLSAIPADHPLNMGMLGMHGNYAPNLLSAKADLIVAVGMRFSDRVTSNPSTFVKNARIIHIDIDASEHDKVLQAHLAIAGDALEVLKSLIDLVEPAMHAEWLAEFRKQQEVETGRVIQSDLSCTGEQILMGAVIRKLSERFPADTIVTTDIGQHQMKTARYYKLNYPRQLITSGGLGTMGFGLPAAIGAKTACPDKTVLALLGDGGFQMNIQEIMTIVQENADVKIVVFNNGYLGMVRQWQELFFESRYASTGLMNPDFVKVVDAMGIPSRRISSPSEIDTGIEWLLTSDGPGFLEVVTDPAENVFPMVPPGAPVSEMWLENVNSK
ncbi:MAG: biosynthetic-type acetolactate synthase large subunit [Bacteroidales bacterium]|nr:biosynthetic-type acetolactate synthase large subunit [Bacteroidales bacterium]